jgi:hypothetical protein
MVRTLRELGAKSKKRKKVASASLPCVLGVRHPIIHRTIVMASVRRYSSEKICATVS